VVGDGFHDVAKRHRRYNHLSGLPVIFQAAPPSTNTATSTQTNHLNLSQATPPMSIKTHFAVSGNQNAFLR
jgi:hypothetical protein